MNSLTFKIQNNLERTAVAYVPYIPRVAAVLATVLVLSAFLYAAFLLEAVAQAASRTAAERQISDLNTEVGVLEGQYLAATQALTPARAQALGFVAPAQVSTVVVGTAPLSFVGH